VARDHSHAMAMAVHGAQIVVFGDSWGTFGRAEFQRLMNAQGITVDNVAVGATTAGMWSLVPNALRDAVARNPDCRWVWLTIGGNDAAFKLPFGTPVEQIIEEALRDTSIFLRPLFAANPNVRVVQFGYDILTFSMGICPLVGLGLFPQCNGNTRCMNTNFIRLQHDYVEKLSELFPQHDSVNLLGSMQRAAGVPGADVGRPNLDFYTPDAYMNDCIHASSLGYNTLFADFYRVYWQGQLESYFNTTSAKKI